MPKLFKAFGFTFLLLGTCFLKGQVLPKNYKALGDYIKSEKVDSVNLYTLLDHLRIMPAEGRDSLLDYVFPAIEYRYENASFAEKGFAYHTLVVAAYQLTGNLEYAHTCVEKEIELYEAAGLHNRVLTALSHKMFLLADMDSTLAAFEASLQMQDKLKEVEDAASKSLYLRQLCVFYQNINKVEYGIAFCNEGLEFNKEHKITKGNGSMYETLALFAEENTEDYADVIALRRKAVKSSVEEGDTMALRVVYRNMARTFMEVQEPDSVVKYFNLTFELYRTHPYFIGWFADQVKYAEFLMEQRRMDEAAKVIDTLDQRFDGNRSFLTNYYQIKELFAVQTGDIEAYKKWSGKLDSLVETRNEEHRLKVSEELAVKYETAKKEAENDLLRAKSRSRLYQVLGLVGALVAVIVVFVLVLQRRKRDKTIFKQNQKLLQLELEKTSTEKEQIEKRNKTLLNDTQNYIKQILEQQTINTELMEMIEELRVSEESPLVMKKTAQMKSRLGDQFTKQAYHEITSKLEEVYPAFFAYLIEEIGADKDYEILITAMYFLGYDTKDIAAICNRTEKAVRNMRYRVRKKLHMADKEDFVDFLNQLSKTV